MEKFFTYLSFIYVTMIRLYVNKVVLFLFANTVRISMGLQICQIRKVTEAGSSHSARSQGNTDFLAYFAHLNR